MFFFSNWLKRSKHKPTRQSSGPGLNECLNGYRLTALVYTASKIKLTELLSDRPASSADIAKSLNVDAPSLHRLLRALSTIRFCEEHPGGRFSLGPIGTQFKADPSARHLAILAGEEYSQAWNNLSHTMMTGATAFDDAFGQSPWEHRANHPELNYHFDAWLRQGAIASAEAILAAHDFSQYRCVADIGGGQGDLLGTLLKAHPELHGILVDQPHVIEAASEKLGAADLMSRCTLHAANFFTDTLPPADVYILKSVLHDWTDEQCLNILARCHAALEPSQPLLLVEKIMPLLAAEGASIVMSDIHMLAVTGGLERTTEQYDVLLKAAGFKMGKVTKLRTGHSLIESLKS